MLVKVDAYWINPEHVVALTALDERPRDAGYRTRIFTTEGRYDVRVDPDDVAALLDPSSAIVSAEVVDDDESTGDVPRCGRCGVEISRCPAGDHWHHTEQPAGSGHFPTVARQYGIPCLNCAHLHAAGTFCGVILQDADPKPFICECRS